MNKKIKIVYCTPSIYIAGGIERVLTTKVNYLANQNGKYEITIILMTAWKGAVLSTIRQRKGCKSQYRF